MIYLSFKVGGDCYALKLHQLIDVVPAVALKRVPEAPPWLPGLLHFRQHVVPVIDLCHLVTGKPAIANLGTRIAMLPYRDDDDDSDTTAHDEDHIGHCFGIMAEAMIGTIDSRDLSKPPEGVSLQQAPWLGEVACYGDQLVQLIEPQALLTDEVRALLQVRQT